MQRLLIGLDVGGTKTAALLANTNGKALAEATIPTYTATPEALLGTISRAVRTVLAEIRATPRQIESIGMGVPGLVDPATGIVQLAVNLNLQRYPLGPAVAARFKTPAFLENDVRTAAVGAFAYVQQAEPVQSLAYVSIGTGVAAGVILNGRLHRGHNGMAGEIGHMIVEPGGERCNCGQYGCLETIVAGPAIVRQLIAAAPELQNTVRHAGDVYAAAVQGHAAAQAVVQRVGQYLSRGIQWLVMMYDVEKIVIGGGVTRSGDAFLAPIRHELAQLRQHSPLATALLGEEKVHLMPPEYNPGLWGAVRLAVNGKQGAVNGNR